MLKDYEQLGENDKIICNFREIGHTIRRISEGKGSQKRVLIVLRRTGTITQSELTERLGIQPGSASEVLGKLEAAGLILRTPSESDRRTTDVSLTKEGKAAADDAYIQREKRQKQMLSCFSEEEKKELLVLLEKLNDDWSKKYEEIICGNI